MLQKLVVFTCLLLAAIVTAQAAPGKPNFGPALYADGELWGTKFTALLPAPNDHNHQSFDALFIVVNGPEGQPPVAEAAPRNPAYNGGRWDTHQVVWTQAGFDAHPGGVPVLTSYADILEHYNLGHLDIIDTRPPDGPPQYFQCPLLPLK